MYFPPLFLALLAALTLPCRAQTIPYGLQHVIPAPPVGTHSGALLGASVAMDGGYTVVGAPYDRAGVVKVLDSTTGALLFILPNPEPKRFDAFGRSVAVSGTRVAVGVPHHDTFGTQTGRVYVYDVAGATPTVPVATLEAPRPVAFDYFGYSVSISGTRVLVGAYGGETVSNIGGTAYLYELGGRRPTVPVLTLKSPVSRAFDAFGVSVGQDGSRMVVGDGQHAYVFELTGATPAVAVLSLRGPADFIKGAEANTVAISGSRVVMGVPYNDTGAFDTGCVFVYELAGPTPTVPAFALYNPSPVNRARFGYAVAISGARVVVGSLGNNVNLPKIENAYVYDLLSATPAVPFLTLTHPTPGLDDEFGSAVAISGTRVVVGARLGGTVGYQQGSAYLYDVAGATPTVPVLAENDPKPSEGDLFGYAVAISGTRTVVGAPSDNTGKNNAGSAYVYDSRSATPTVPVLTLNNPRPEVGDQFGRSVSISGPRVVVGAPGDNARGTDEGSAYVYDLRSATPAVPVATLKNPQAAPGKRFGWSVSIWGARVVVGADGSGTSLGGLEAGSAFVFDLKSVDPRVPTVILKQPDPQARDHFGWSVAISQGFVVVGAVLDDAGFSDAGSAYVYNLRTPTPEVSVATLRASDPMARGQFGASVGISGTRVVVGAYQRDVMRDGRGSAHVFDLSTATPTVPVLVLTSTAGTGADRFGSGVAISGNRVLVSAPSEDRGAMDAGRVYLYKLNSPTPTVPVAKLKNPFPTALDSFGRSVALEGTMVAVGTPFDDVVAENKGTVYRFTPGR